MRRTLFAILYQAGLKREEILALDEREVIRLEKKIKANQELWEGISPDEAERTTEALKKYLPQVKQFYSNEVLFKLFQHDHSNLNLYHPLSYEGEELAAMQAFFHVYLEEDLIGLFKRLLSEREFLKLTNWQMARPLFSSGLKHTLDDLLLAHLESIVSVLEEKLPMRKLPGRIPFATDPLFFVLLDKIREQAFDDAIYRILKFYTANGAYTRGRQFADNILLAAYKYKPEDEMLKSAITLTGLYFGGNKRYVYYALGVIVLLLAALWLYVFSSFRTSKPEIPVAFVPKTPQEKSAYVYRQDLLRGELNSDRYKYSYTGGGNSCSGFSVPLNEKVEFTTPAEHSRKLSELLNTGENVGEDQTSRIERSDSNFGIVNTTGQHLFVFVYVSICRTMEWGYLPCKDPGFAYNRVYIAPGDTLSIDYRVDSLAFQSGEELYRIKESSGSRRTSYEFCPVSNIDSLLIGNTLLVPYPQRLLNGFLECSKPKASYQLSWSGQADAIFSRNHGSYLEPRKLSVPGGKR